MIVAPKAYASEKYNLEVFYDYIHVLKFESCCHSTVRFAQSKSDRARPAPLGRARQGRATSAPAGRSRSDCAPNRRSAAFILCCINTLPAKAFAGVGG